MAQNAKAEVADPSICMNTVQPFRHFIQRTAGRVAHIFKGLDQCRIGKFLHLRGGICSAQDILEFISVGASLVQVGTHLYREPTCLPGILDELRELLASEGMDSLEALRGNFDGDRDRLPDRQRPVP